MLCQLFYINQVKEPPNPLPGSGRSGPPLRVQSGPVLPRLVLGRGYAPGGEGRKPPDTKAKDGSVNKRTVTGGHSKMIKEFVAPMGAGI